MPVPDHLLKPDQKARVEFVVGAVQHCESRQHAQFKAKAERLIRRYHGYRGILAEHAQIDNPAQRREFLRELSRENNGFGPPLIIPYAFATVETVLPRMLSNRPRMLITPRGQASEANVQNMRYLIDSQQERINYELVLQDIAKDGLVPGLGVQKVLWRTDKRKRKMLARGVLHPLIVTEGVVTEFDGPVAERVDPIDFFGDPYASDLASPAGRIMEWAVARTWRSDRYVLERMAKGLWNPLREDLVKSLGSKQKFEETQQARADASGLGGGDGVASWGGVHEILEFHDGDRLITVLDREWLCVDMPNPYWHGELPFQLFRPTKVPGSLYGIGEIEPIEGLCEEMDDLRTNRRDNQRLTNQQVFAYDEGTVDSADVKWGPGKLIPVNGDPKEALQPIPVRPLDNASYQEEAALVANIDRVSGVSDVTSGAESQVQQTATGAQLLNASASVRIQNKTRRLEVETIKPGARHFGLLSQQMIRSTVEIRIPAPPTIDNPDARYQWIQIDPLGLQGEFEWEADGGATAPENVPQKRQDAQMKLGLAQNPAIQPQAMLLSALEDLGLKQPQQYLAPQEARVPAQAISELEQALTRVYGPGVKQITEYVMGALQQQDQQQAVAA